MHSTDRLPLAVLALVAVGAFPGAALALPPCGDWDAQLSVDPKTDAESLALALQWATGPTACVNKGSLDWPGTDHYEIYKRTGDGDNTGTCTSNTTTFNSSSHTSGERLNTTTNTQWSDFVHRSAKDFRYEVVACANAACSRTYGTWGTESVSNVEDFDCTETERWVILDVDDKDPDNWNTGVDWVATGNASAALFYPSGFTDSSSTDVEDVLGLWWSHGSCGKEDCVSYKRAHTDDPGPQRWNEYSDWENETVLLEETGGTGDYSALSHPWVGASDDGTKSVTLWVRRSKTSPRFSDLLPDNHVIGLTSEDVAGADYGLLCASGATCEVDGDTCSVGDYCDFDDDSSDGGVASIEICADATSGCTYLSGARHGRLMWNYLANPTFDLTGTDEPWMVFTGSPDGHMESEDTGWSTTCAQVGSPMDDLYRAKWNGSAWQVVTDSSGCPEPQSGYGSAGDLHDPGIAPLPGGEFKMYAKYGNTDVYVAYWNDVDEEWEDETPIEIVLDDASSTDMTHCVDNIDVVVHAGPPPTESMFFKARSRFQDDAAGCFDADVSETGLLYADHAN